MSSTAAVIGTIVGVVAGHLIGNKLTRYSVQQMNQCVLDNINKVPGEGGEGGTAWKNVYELCRQESPVAYYIDQSTVPMSDYLSLTWLVLTIGGGFAGYYAGKRI